MSSCTEPDCDQEAIGRGLCSKHYQQARRREMGVRTKRGPAPKYSDEIRSKYDGAPQFTIRMDPELRGWVQDRGGGVWVREALKRLHTSYGITAQDQAEFHRRIQKVVSGAIREAKRAHGEVDPGSVGKRVASQLWADMALPNPTNAGESDV